MPPSPKRETRAGGAALGLLDVFASVGAQWFDLTFTDTVGGKVGFCGSRTFGQLQSALPKILREARHCLARCHLWLSPID